MKIATFNVNGVNGRLSVLLRWLEEAQPDVACLQELKAPDPRFPRQEIERAGYGAIWHGQKAWNGVAILARGREPIETRRGLPGDPDDDQSRYSGSSWWEVDGPPVVPPTRTGFGSRMIEKALAGYFQGTAEIDYQPDGVVFTLQAPVEALTANSGKGLHGSERVDGIRSARLKRGFLRADHALDRLALIVQPLPTLQIRLEEERGKTLFAGHELQLVHDVSASLTMNLNHHIARRLGLLDDDLPSFEIARVNRVRDRVRLRDQREAHWQQ